ncbi:hydratase [Vibrio sp. 10N.261.55.A7]|uniref:hydratase n=1 Tax=Vibrio sp. 10N.261.55.A7 TaxID=1880851 RepID=UPI000C85539A|nr:hydratase [Vibrio sp. 10N.261.55.A7]PMJ91720.1 hydratase [Vibrio sp. 10N.261.55.A7]
MTNKYQQAATELLNRRVAGTKAPRIEASHRPNSLEDALQVQSSMIDLRSDKVGGWKCLLPLADDKFVVAPIFADTVQQGETCELFADKQVVRIEPEIAFVLNQDLPANTDGYSEAQINEAIGSCHMALELMQSRFADDSGAEFFEKLADGLVNQGLYVGPEIDRETAFNASTIDITVTQQDQVQKFAGKHPNTMPATPIYWLINTMVRRGVDFKAGEAIITGSYCGIVEVEFNKATTIRYEGIGEYQVTFNEKR